MLTSIKIGGKHFNFCKNFAYHNLPDDSEVMIWQGSNS